MQWGWRCSLYPNIRAGCLASEQPTFSLEVSESSIDWPLPGWHDLRHYFLWLSKQPARQLLLSPFVHEKIEDKFAQQILRWSECEFIWVVTPGRTDEGGSRSETGTGRKPKPSVLWAGQCCSQLGFSPIGDLWASGRAHLRGVKKLDHLSTNVHLIQM